MSEQIPQVIFILGGPGSGKGTQSELLCTQRGFSHLSVGDVLRAEMGEPGSTYGPIIEDNMRHGRIGPKEITVALLKNAMLKHSTGSTQNCGFVIDGFPRKMDQAEYFEETITVPLAIILLDCPEDAMKDRLHMRASSLGRMDDNEPTIEKRMETFRTTTKVVLDHYEQRHKVIHVDGTGSKEAVHTRILNVVDEVLLAKQTTSRADMSLDDAEVIENPLASSS